MESVIQGFRLSPQQEHLCRVSQPTREGGWTARCEVAIEGVVDSVRLRTALTRVIARHEILRTTFHPLQGLALPVQIVGEAPSLLWTDHDLTALAPPEAEAALERLAAQADATPFDLREGPLVRADLARVSADGRVLLLAMPALVADVASLRNLAGEIARACQDGDVWADGKPPLQYADAAEILHEWLAEPAAELPIHRPTALFPPPSGLAAPPQTVRASLDIIASEAAQHLAGRLGVPFSAVLLAAWSATLWHSTGESDLLVGAAFDGRTFTEMEQALGLFARYLPVRCEVGPGSTLRGLAGALMPRLAELAEVQDGFDPEALERMLPATDGTPIWPFGFDCEPPALPIEGLPRFTFRGGSAEIDRFALRLSLLAGPPLRCELHYDPQRFGRKEAKRLLARFVTVLEQLAEAPDHPVAELHVLSADERRELLASFNHNAAPVPAYLSCHQLFEEQVRRAPHATALISGEQSLTLADLNASANRLARRLAALGVGPESRVGLCLARSTDLVVSLLATLKAGGAYVPLDPGYPAERLAFLLADAGVSVLLTHDGLLARLAPPDGARVLCLDREDERRRIERQAAEDLAPAALPDSAAYVIYTSGSTGRPKGVVVPHRGLVGYLRWAREAYGTADGPGAPVHSSLGFDLTVTSLLVPLISGTTVTLLPEEEGVEALAAALREGRGFSLVKLTPAHLEVLRQLLAPAEAARTARVLVIGGEALRAEGLSFWRQNAPATRLINEYGPTETVVGCATYEVRASDQAFGPVPIGRPIANACLYVVGPRGLPVVAGVPGELWIGGGGVARGYLDRPELTAERFAPDPFGEAPGARVYRTGDLVRLRDDGQLEFLGRIDDQVKIRGFRIEPGEIEAALAAHPEVREAAVAARETPDGGRLLVAYAVFRGAARPSAAELRAFLAEKLPEHMIPAQFVPLDALPLSAHGKVDRRALPEPSAPETEAAYAAPRTLEEDLLTEIFGAILGVERVGIDDNFFNLGGDSIRSMQVLSLARERGLSLNLQDLFRTPTIRGLAPRIQPGGEAEGAQTAPFSLVSPADRALLPGGLDDAYPLAQLQTGMLFHSAFSPETAIYHDLHSFHLRGRYHRELLQTAVDRAARRHAVLRTSFDLSSFSEPLQLVHATETFRLPVTEEDLRNLPTAEQADEVAAWLVAERHRGFDLSSPPLVRFHVHLRSDETFQLTLSFHHSVLDGWSAASLLSELFRLYHRLQANAAFPEEPPPGATFREFIHLERSAIASPETREHWRRHLAGAAVARLPRRPVDAGTPQRAADLGFLLPEPVAAGVRALARRATVPLKSVLLAAHLRVLGFLSAQTDVMTGVVTNGRPEQTDGELVLGLFLNTLPFRLETDGRTWTDLSQAAFDLEREMLAHRRYPLAEIQAAQGGLPLFEIAFNFLHFHVYQGLREHAEGLELLERYGYEETDFPLANFQLDPDGAQIHLRLNYPHGQIPGEQAASWLGYYERALAALAAEPDGYAAEAPLLAPAERVQILAEWGDGGPLPGLPAGLHQLFAAQARRTPSATALVCRGERLSYAELDARAEALARRLMALGAGPEHRVGVCCGRNAHLVVALLAVLKSGGAYLPLDPAYPAERLAYTLADAQAELLLTEERLLPSLPAAGLTLLCLDRPGDAEGPGEPTSDLHPRPFLPDQLAYSIYTSGSTGQPKGVAISHRSASALLAWAAEVYGAEDLRGVLASTSVCFDLSVFELFLPLARGGTVFLVENALALAELPEAAEITLINTVPSALSELLRLGGLPSGLRVVNLAGEPLAHSLVERVHAADAGLRVYNLYGPSEDTTYSTFALIPRHDPLPPSIGRPVGGGRAHLLDGALQPVPAGVTGEIFLGGAGLARGYLGRPDATAASFVPDPFAAVSGERLYRTGDLGRFRLDGEIEFLGRRDHQVKIRGFRIELGEVEAALARHPEVREAVVAVWGAGEERRLVAYLVPRADPPPAAAELRPFLRQWLPDHMLPASLVHLEALPLTPNGKVDRRRLPDPGQGEPLGGEAHGLFVAPRGPVEETIAQIWTEVLGLPRVGIRDSFFDLGGHSLQATRVIARMRATFDAEVPLRSLFETPTVAGLAAAVESAWRSGKSPLPPLLPRPRTREIPLSYEQHRLWVFSQIAPESPAYNLPVALRFQGDLRPEVLAASLSAVALRHEILRTTFPAPTGFPVQRIVPAAPVALPVVDLAGLPERLRDPEVRILAAAELMRPFDLARGPLLRGRLLRLGARDHALALTLHHIVTDGWSVALLVHEVGALYPALVAGRPSPLPPLPIQFADYAIWQRAWTQGPALADHVASWRQQLAGAPEVLDLPADRPRTPLQTFRGGRRHLPIPADLVQGLEGLARRRGATLFMGLLTVFQTLLARYTGSGDIVVGTPVAGRNRLEVERLIGLFVNTLVLRTDLGGNPDLESALARVRESVLRAFAHQDLPFEKLLAELQPQRSLMHTPLFQVLFAFQNTQLAAAPQTAELPGLTLRPMASADREEPFELSLQLLLAGDGLIAQLSFSRDRFDAATAERLLRHLRTLFAGAVASPDLSLFALPLLDGGESHQLLVEWNDTLPVGAAPHRVTERFAAQAARTPEASALLFEDRTLTYGELNRQANRIAHRLRALGVGPGAFVGVCAERSPELIAALLGVLKAGAAYLPLDPGLPDQRLAFLLGDAMAGHAAPILLVGEALRERLETLPSAPAGLRILTLEPGLSPSAPGGDTNEGQDEEEEEEEEEDITPLAASEDPAYLIYTSGTTGTPKAVVVEHRNLASVLDAAQARFDFSSDDRMPCLAPFSFDIFLFELFGPLLVGGTSLLFALQPALDLPSLVESLAEATCLHAVPALMRQIVEAGRDRGPFPALRALFVGGDVVPLDLLAALPEVFPRARLHVLYGPTEATIICCSQELTGGLAWGHGATPVGRPLPGAILRLIDGGGQAVPVRVAGEILIGGSGVTRGYLGRPELTAERFVTRDGLRFYKSGDLARWRTDGALEFLGRLDGQVKIRGFRVELGEIEAALVRQPGVRECAVVARDEGPGRRLVAYLVAEEGAALDLDELREALRRLLPEYMVPAAWVVLPALPLTAHGKVDRRALPAPAAIQTAEPAAPRNETERLLARLWAEVLRIDLVGIHDNFFSLGGDSILAIQVATRAQRVGVAITPRLLFQHPTVAELAATAGSQQMVRASQGPVIGPVPFIPIQRSFFAGSPVEPHHFTQSMLLECARPLDPVRLKAALKRVATHHDALRHRFLEDSEGWRQTALPPGPAALARIDLAALPPERLSAAIETAAAEVQASLDLSRGPIHRALLFETHGDEHDRFLWTVHHLVVDGVSWRLLLEDLATAFDKGELPAKTTSVRAWAEHLEAEAASPAARSELAFWLGQPWEEVRPLPVDLHAPATANTLAGARSVALSLDAEETRALLREVVGAYRAGIEEVLLSALARACAGWSGSPVVLLDREGHGREELPGVDLSRTVGWLTVVHPVLLDLRGVADPGGALGVVQETLSRVPRGGLGWGMLQGVEEARADLAALPKAEMSFNYLGQIDRGLPSDLPFHLARESSGPARSVRAVREHALEWNGRVLNDRLLLTCTYGSRIHLPATVERLAAAFGAALRELIAEARSRGAGRRTPAHFPLAGLGRAELDVLLAQAEGRIVEDVYPLSPMQEGMLFHTLYASEPGVYLWQTSCRLSGGFSPAAFRRALARAAERHAILRTSFVWEGLEKPLQVVAAEVHLPLLEIDWSGLPEEERHRRLKEQLAADLRQGFDLSRPPLMRLRAADEGGGEYRLLWTTHMLLLDGWSMSALIGEIFRLYEGFRRGEDPQPELPPPYRDYIAWLVRQDTAAAERFWRRELAGFAAPTPLPGAAAAGTGGDLADAEERLALSEEVTGQLKALARGAQVTLNTLVQGAWALLLSRASGERDVVFGATVSGRPAELAGIESMIGLFINTLPVRARVEPDRPLLAWLRELQDRHTQARQLEHVPLVRIQGWSEVPRGTRLFDSLVVFENYPVDDSMRGQRGSLIVDEVRLRESNNYPLTLRAVPGESLVLIFSYDAARPEGAAVASTLGHLRTLLSAMAQAAQGLDEQAALRSLAHLTPEERQQILHEWNRPGAGGAAEPPLPRRFEEWAARAPLAPALTFESDTLSYGELDRRANRIARRLRSLGVGPEIRVGLYAERSPEMIVGLLAIQKAGGAYVPLDPDVPSERLAYLLEDSGVGIVLVHGERAAALPEGPLRLPLDEENFAAESAEPLPDGPEPDHAAYVIYTSGSTGRPKGVVVTHANAARLFTATRDDFGFSQEDVWTLFHSFAFDFSVWEIWGALAHGGRLVIVPYWVSRSPEEFLALLARERVTVLNQTPSAFRQLLQAEEADLALRWVVFGGEALDLPGLAPWFTRHGDERPRLVNMYGITETTVHVTFRSLSASDLQAGSVIGGPLSDLQVYLVDSDQELVAAGAPGEILVGGRGVARGYLNRPELTAERFIPDPWSPEPGARLYRSGDLARYRLGTAAMDLLYLGRIDHQVKIRGFRIEPGEIEAALLANPGVRAAVVVVRQGKTEARRLVAYVVPAGAAAPPAAELRAFLKGRLPDAMIPAAFVSLAALPLTANGKLDRRALPAPDDAALGSDEEHLAPATPVEEALANVWAEVLGVERVGALDSFFALGGDSILSLRVLARARDLGLSLSLQQIFEHPTLRSLARVVGEEEAPSLLPGPEPLAQISEADRSRLPEDVEDAYPLTGLQAGMLFHTEYSPGEAVYHDIFSVHLKAPFAETPLRLALDRVTDRHPVLRTSFDLAGFGEPLQLVHRGVAADLEITDLRPLAADEQESFLAAWMEEEKGCGFDWSHPPLLRFRVHRRSDLSFQLSLSFHHAILDGWSVASLLAELFRTYLALTRGEEAPDPGPVGSYGHFVALERAALGSAASRRYWNDRLAREEVTRLPRWRPAPAASATAGSAVHEVSLSPDLSRDLQQAARSRGLPLKTLLLAAHCRVLAALSGDEEVVTGLVVNGRPEEEWGERTLGLFLNTLPFHLRVAGGSWTDLARSAFAAEREMLVHRRFPLVELQRTSGRPLFEAVFNFVHFHVYQGLERFEEIRSLGGGQFFEQTSFTFLAGFSRDPFSGRIRLRLEHDAGQFPRHQIEEIAAGYERTLAHLAGSGEGARYETVPLLSEEERRQLLAEWRRPLPAEPEPAPLPRRFEEWAARAPLATALTFESDTLSYGELDRRANRIAHRLRSLGVGPESRVGLCAERSLEMIVGLLAIQKAGGAYVPLDPDVPAERLAFLLEDSGVRIVLTHGERAAALPEGPLRLPLDEEGFAAESAEPLSDGPEPDHAAYVIYTSGSTGKPKGVVVTHANAARLFEATRGDFGFVAEDVWTLFHSFAFDFSVWEIWGALAHGGRLVIVPFWVSRSPEEFLALLARERVTILNQTPSAFRQLIQAEEEAVASGSAPDLALRWVVFGGEALDLPGLAPWFARHGDEQPRLVNMYGITETTVHVTFRPISTTDIDGGSVIGGPLSDLRVYVADRHLEPAPTFVGGEILVGGRGVARGYLNRPDLTAERFIPDPWSPEPGARLYRSGDLARRLPGGDLEYLGRIDQQVKIRGFRIEPGEVQTALSAHPAVREAVVVARRETGETRLVAYYVADPAAPPTPTELRDYLSDRLPDSMIPAVLVPLAALPLTANGKVDRRALPAPEPGPDSGRAFVAPRNPTEELLAGIWVEVLEIPRLGVEDDFFDLGGHSLLANRVMSRVRASLGIDLPLRALFDGPTVADLARAVEAAWRAGSEAVLPPLARRPDPAEAPLSFAQQRLWFLDQLEPGSPAYNVPFALRLLGRLHVSALAASLGEVVARHEALRTTFNPARTDGLPVQRIHRPRPFALPVIDLAELAPTAREPEARRLAAAAAERPFDLARGPLLRGSLLRLAEREHSILLGMHHIVSDGWSVGVLSREVAALYPVLLEGRPSPLPPLALQYGDFAAWQRTWMTTEVLAAQMAYWREHLAEAPPALDLPGDRPRPPVPSGRGGVRTALLPADLSAPLAALARREGTTLFMTLLAAFDSLLHLYTGRADLVVGTDVANRNPVETEALIGFFVNQLVLRADLSGDPPFRRLLARLREAVLGAYAHQEIPFEQLVEELHPVRDLARQPVFQIAFALHNLPPTALELPGLTILPQTSESGTARFDLSVTAVALPAGLQLGAEYSSDLFDPTTVDRLLGHFGTLLGALAADPDLPLSRLPLLGAAERHQASVEWNDSAASPGGGDAAFHHLFAAHAAARPEVVAAVCGDSRLTYGELARSAGRLAGALAGRQAFEPGAVVPLLAERGLEFLSAVLGFFAAGCAYLPLDPRHPADRWVRVVVASGAPLVVADRALAPALGRALAGLPDAGRPRIAILEELLAGEEPAGPPRPWAPDLPAYVIYTSGSTGQPKGAVVAHRGMLNHLRAKVEALDLTAREAIAQTASQSFDISVWQLLAALVVGGTVYVVPDELANDPLRLLDLVDAQGITVLETVPSLLRLLLDELETGSGARPALRSLRWMIPTGEALPADLCRRWLRRYPGVPLINAYGPTECSDDVTHHPVRDLAAAAAQIPIGRPVRNLRLHVLGSGMLPLPIGVPGELFVGGAGLGLGYLRDGGRTAEAWVPDPTPEPGAPDGGGARLYRTGDLARWRADGRLDFLGRIDHQVKIRGNRIELGEIEAVLARYPGVRQAAVLARQDRPGDHPRLVAYVVAAPPADPVELRAFVAERLPGSMVPAAFLQLTEMPLSANGKLDRKALPAPDPVAPAAGDTAPRGSVEEAVAGIWKQILGVDRLGIHDNFFELGGHSLLATQMVSRLRGALDVELPLRLVFERPTVAELAREVEAALAAGWNAELPPITPVQRSAEMPLSFAQQRLWFLDEMEPGRTEYNIPVAVRLAGRLNVAALAAGLAEVVRRHEALRTTFAVVDGRPVQRIGEPPATPLPRVDLEVLPDAARAAESRRLALAEAARPFDLHRGPLLRGVLLRLSADEHAVLLGMHHIVSDGWSVGIFVREISALYGAFAAGEPSPLPEPAIQYADFAAWQRRWLDGAPLERQLAYWQRSLAGLPVLKLPTDRPRPPVQTFRGRHRPVMFAAELTRDLRDLAEREQATMFMVLLAAFATLLRQASGQEDVVVGTDVAGRNRDEIESLIGFFVNQLVLRLDTSGDPSFNELLARSREVSLAAYSHQDLPFERLVAALQAERDLSRTPLFQAKLVLQNAPGAVLDLPGLRLSLLPLENETAKFDLLLDLNDLESGLAGRLEYNRDLFEPATIEALLAKLEIVLATAAARPEVRIAELSALLDAEDRRRAADREREFREAGHQRLRKVERKAVRPAGAG